MVPGTSTKMLVVLEEPVSRRWNSLFDAAEVGDLGCTDFYSGPQFAPQNCLSPLIGILVAWRSNKE